MRANALEPDNPGQDDSRSIRRPHLNGFGPRAGTPDRPVRTFARARREWARPGDEPVRLRRGLRSRVISVRPGMLQDTEQVLGRAAECSSRVGSGMRIPSAANRRWMSAQSRCRTGPARPGSATNALRANNRADSPNPSSTAEGAGLKRTSESCRATESNRLTTRSGSVPYATPTLIGTRSILSWCVQLTRLPVMNWRFGTIMH